MNVMNVMNVTNVTLRELTTEFTALTECSRRGLVET